MRGAACRRPSFVFPGQPLPSGDLGRRPLRLVRSLPLSRQSHALAVLAPNSQHSQTFSPHPPREQRAHPGLSTRPHAHVLLAAPRSAISMQQTASLANAPPPAKPSAKPKTFGS